MKKILSGFDEVSHSEFVSFELIRFSFLVIGLALAVGASAMEQPPFEMACRMKAKEAAAETYKGCVTENRKAQIDQVRTEYQAKLKALKDEYDQELKRAAGRSSEGANQAPQAPTSSEVQSNSHREVTKAPTKSAGRLATGRTALPSKRRALRESSAATESQAMNNQDMSVRLRTMPSQLSDDSSMDIPEPIPVEGASSDSQGI